MMSLSLQCTVCSQNDPFGFACKVSPFEDSPGLWEVSVGLKREQFSFLRAMWVVRELSLNCQGPLCLVEVPLCRYMQHLHLSRVPNAFSATRFSRLPPMHPTASGRQVSLPRYTDCYARGINDIFLLSCSFTYCAYTCARSADILVDS